MRMKYLLAAAIVAATPTLDAATVLPAKVDGNELPTLAPMLQRATPGVVSVATRGTVEVQRNPLLNDPFFRRFFNVPDQPQERAVQGLGSGVIVDARDGYILTNNHVVERADEITVTLQDGRTLTAEVVGTDPPTDLALLKVEAENLVALPLADSDRLRVGDFVVAIGNPFGLGQTVTSGIVSGLGRSSVLRAETYQDFIQTDAAINRGNSGGALVNLNGELVGINTAILSGSGGNIGIGFAIPVNMARSVMQQLLEHGEVRRGMLGVNIQNLDAEIAEALGIKETQGAVISNVIPESPAEKAGLKTGDVIVALDGKPIANFNELRNRIGLMQIGESVRITVLRDGGRRVLTAEIGEITAQSVPVDRLHPSLGGASFADITDGSPYYGRIQGVVITGVEPNSRAVRNGLQEGDVIVSINRRPVRNMEEFRQAVATDEPRLLVNIRRGNGALFLVIR